MGLAPAFLSCLFAGACSAFGLYLLSVCARQVGRPRFQPSTAFTSSGPSTPAKRIVSSSSSECLDESLDAGLTPPSGQEKPEASFNEIALLTFGKGWATRCFDAAIAIKCFGVSVSYLIIVKVSLQISCNSFNLADKRYSTDIDATSDFIPLASPAKRNTSRNFDVA
jgi:amino acid permease